jgi:hypothetical protein
LTEFSAASLRSAWRRSPAALARAGIRKLDDAGEQFDLASATEIPGRGSSSEDYLRAGKTRAATIAAAQSRCPANRVQSVGSGTGGETSRKRNPREEISKKHGT